MKKKKKKPAGGRDVNRRKIEYRRSNRVSRVGETSKRQRSLSEGERDGAAEGRGGERERKRGHDTGRGKGVARGTWHRASTVKLAQIEKG